jgi:hypothetical protein
MFISMFVPMIFMAIVVTVNFFAAVLGFGLAASILTLLLLLLLISITYIIILGPAARRVEHM